MLDGRGAAVRSPGPSLRSRAAAAARRRFSSRLFFPYCLRLPDSPSRTERQIQRPNRYRVHWRGPSAAPIGRTRTERPAPIGDGGGRGKGRGPRPTCWREGGVGELFVLAPLARAGGFALFSPVRLAEWVAEPEPEVLRPPPREDRGKEGGEGPDGSGEGRRVSALLSLNQFESGSCNGFNSRAAASARGREGRDGRAWERRGGGQAGRARRGRGRCWQELLTSAGPAPSLPSASAAGCSPCRPRAVPSR